jgi:hypothetical protein
VDNDKKRIQMVPLSAPGTITDVKWTCAGEGCGFTWEMEVRLSGKSATWVGKTNSAAPGQYWFKVSYQVPGSCPAE